MALIKLLIAVCCVAFGILVAALNADSVQLDLGLWQVEMPLGQLLLLSLLAGALLGGLAVALSRLWTPAPSNTVAQASQ